MSRKSRLARIERNLDPLEAVICFMREAHEYPSPLSYYQWLRTQPEEEWPLAKIPRQVAMSREAGYRKLPEAERNARLRTPQKEVLFLLGLHEETNALLWRDDERLQYRLLWLVERLRSLTVKAFDQEQERMATFQVAGEADPESPTTRKDEEQQEAALGEEYDPLLSDIRVLRRDMQTKAEAIDLVSRRYLASEDPLFPCYRNRLESTLHMLETMERTCLETLAATPITAEDSFAFYLEQVAAGIPPEERKVKPAIPEVAPLVVEVEEEAKNTARRLVLEAKSRMLAMAGEARAAERARWALLESYDE